MGSSDWRPWREAWQHALYGPDGFYRSRSGPAGHFRTAAHASPRGLLAQALAELAHRAGCTRVVDVGAGRGELLTGLHALAPDLDLLGVDVVRRPDTLPTGIGWSTALPPTGQATLLIAWELLDVIPCDVLQAGPDGTLQLVEVALDGKERLAGHPSPADAAWAARWWPGPYAPGDRVEVGRRRARTWADLIACVESGLVLAVDYDHHLGGRPDAGTLTGFRAGRQVPPVPDGSCDLTAHVALDALRELDATTTRLVRQHQALRSLGLAPTSPQPSTAVSDPRAYLQAMADRSEAGELLDPSELGGFGWLLAPRGDRPTRAVQAMSERT